MKKIFLISTLLLSIILTFVGCDYELYPQTTKPKTTISVEEVITNHAKIFDPENEYNQKQELPQWGELMSIDIDGISSDITFDFIHDTYEARPISTNGILFVNENNNVVGYMTMSIKSDKTAKENVIEDFTNFTIDTETEWTCNKVLYTESELYIFERVQDRESNFGGFVVEVSGKDIATLEEIINSIKFSSQITVNMDAIF